MFTDNDAPNSTRMYTQLSLIAITFILVTLMTGSPLDANAPALASILRLAGYLLTAGVTAFALAPVLTDLRKSLRSFFRAYHITLIPALVLYFLGLIIGALRGPDPAYALQQTFSDAIVFAFALAVFGWLAQDLNARVKTLLRITALITLFVLIPAFIVYLGNLQGWWAINVYNHPIEHGQHRMLMNGPFNHSNHFAYFLMMGSLAAASLATISKKTFDWAWWAVAGVLAAGVAFTFGRGAMLGTAAGVITILFIRYKRLAWLLLIPSLGVITLLTLGGMGVISLPAFIPKVGFAGRTTLWSGAVDKIIEYRFMGVGAGQARGWDGWSMHNFFLEQMGEGGVLTLTGVLLWLVLPILYIRKSGIESKLAWCITGMMLGLMVHGIFWGQFLNGLRILTLVYVCLWTALGTQHSDDGANSPVEAQLLAS